MTTNAIMFHHFHDDNHLSSQGSISSQEFRSLLHFVGIKNILPAKEWLHQVKEGLIADKICLTFDDGLRCQYDVAFPVMLELGLTAFWFAHTGPMTGLKDTLEIYRHFRTVAFNSMEQFYVAFDQACLNSPLATRVTAGLMGFDPKTYLSQYSFYTVGDRRFRYLRDRVLGPKNYEIIMDTMIAAKGFDITKLNDKIWLTMDHLRQLHADGHVLGLHSHNHPTCMTNLPPEKQEEEYITNARYLRGVTNAKPEVIAYPCNSYNAETLKFIARMGVQVGFRSDKVSPSDCILEIPRTDHIEIIQQMASMT